MLLVRNLPKYTFLLRVNNLLLTVLIIKMTSSEEDEYLEEEIMCNGLVLSNIYFPEEILMNILLFLNWKDLSSMRLVCQCWKRIIDSVVCFEKLKSFSSKTLTESFTGPLSKLKTDSVPFNLYYAISKGVFGGNLLRNVFGSGDDPHVCQVDQDFWRSFLSRGDDPHVCQVDQDFWRSFLSRGRQTKYANKALCSQSDCPKYKHWGVLKSGGNGWTVEAEPAGSQPLPPHLPGRSCFVTSFQWCIKEQLITLAEHGLTATIMDQVQPQFDISEWYARRWDCRVRYMLHVFLLDEREEVVQEHQIKAGEDLEDNEWHEVTHSFKDYGPGVRYILFHHAGCDGQYWAGHYGSKMAGGSVIARIPTSRFQKSVVDDQPS